MATLSGHRKTVSSLACSLKRQQLFSGSADGTIRIWGWPEGNFCQQGELEVGLPVNSLMVEDDWLVAGIGNLNVPNLVRIWNMETNAQQDLVGHEGPVYVIVQGNGMLFSAGHDAGIRCWKMVGARVRGCGREARAAAGAPPRLALTARALSPAPGARPRNAQDPASAQFLLVGVLQAHTAPVQLLQVAGTSLFSASRDNTIKQWDLTTGQGVCSVTTAHTEFMMGLRLYENYLFSAGLDGKVAGAHAPPVTAPPAPPPPPPSARPAPAPSARLSRVGARRLAGSTPLPPGIAAPAVQSTT